MTTQLRAELLKHRSTPTNLGLIATMAGLVVFAALFHGLTLPGRTIEAPDDQLKVVFGWGGILGTMFAALAGVLSVTAEHRFGTIRPTLLANPKRERVLVAKVFAAAIVGAPMGLLAGALAVGAGVIAFEIRGIPLSLDTGDYLTLVAGGTVAAALWAGIGVGIGTIIRGQVPAVTGVCAWLLFVETVILGSSDALGAVGRHFPGALGRAATGQDALLAPGLAAVFLALYLLLAVAAASIAARRDIV